MKIHSMQIFISKRLIIVMKENNGSRLTET